MEADLIGYSEVADNNRIVSVGNITKIFNKSSAVAIKEENLLKMKSQIM